MYNEKHVTLSNREIVCDIINRRQLISLVFKIGTPLVNSSHSSCYAEIKVRQHRLPLVR